jgi:hypothetical protein
MEIWKRVRLEIRPNVFRDYPYFVSNMGRIKNVQGHVLKPWKRGQRNGTYLCVDLCLNGTKKRIDLQRLVALHFVPNPKHKPEVNHWNMDPFDNRAENLEWCTRSENEKHKHFMTGCFDVPVTV